MNFLNNTQCANIIKQRDWSQHPLGSPETWPDELKLQLAMIFRSEQPFIIYWGEAAYTFFNDAFLPHLGAGDQVERLGLTGKEMWLEVWDEILGKQFCKVKTGEGSTTHRHQLIKIFRNNHHEKTYWNYSFSPIFSLAGEISGVLVCCIETTDEVKSEFKLKGILEGSNQLIAAVDLEGKYILFNEAHEDEAYRIFGKRPYVGMDVYELLDNVPAELRSVEKTWERALLGEKFSAIESFSTPDNKTVHLQLNYSPMVDEDNNIIGSTQVAHDISNVLAKDKALTNSQNIFAALSEAMPQIVWTADSEGQNEFCNKKWTEYTGISREDALGKKFYSAFHPDDLPGISKEFKVCLAEKREFSYESRLQGKNGEFKWFLIRALPYKLENGDWKWVGTCTDIHEFKILTDRLKKSEETLHATLTTSGVGMWQYNLDTGRVILSETQMHNWGINPEEFNGTLEECIQFIHPEDRAKVIEEINNTIENDTKYEIEYRIIHPLKKIRWMSAKGIIYKRDADSAERLVGTSIDITQKKEDFLNLQKARRLAESANNLKSAFLANMSHEIRTPLGVIAGFCDLLASKEINDQEKVQYSRIIKKTTTQITQIINDILDLSKVEAGEFKIYHQQFKWSDLLGDVAQAFSQKAKAKKLELYIKIDDDVKDHFISDPTRIKQILFNLVGNAIKFSEKGKITIELKKLSFGVLLLIHDEGIGISESNQPRLFKPFSQADDSITRNFGGTGLGLALSKKLATLLGGDLTLEYSKEGVGSVFGLELAENMNHAEVPIHENIDSRAAFTPKPISGLRILLVEDAKENQILFKIQLEAKGVEVVTANNGLEGVEKALTSNFDLVLMDIQMPILDGYSATKRLRELGYDKPIIALTAHAMSEVREKCLGVGCNDYATKPLNFEVLESKIQNAVRGT